MRRFWRDERGSTAIEYAFMAGLVSVAIYGAAKTIGLNLASHYFMPVAANLS